MRRDGDTASSRKILYILLALAVAVAMWLFVDVSGGGEVERTITDIPITYVGEDALADRGLMLVDDGTSASVDLTLAARRSLVIQPDRDDVRITADLSDVTGAGVQSIPYDVSFADSRITSGMIEERSIRSATVTISELNRKTVDIICDLVGNVADGYSAGELQLSQTTLEIRGQEADIADVSYVKVTLDIGEDATATVSESLEFTYYDARGQVLDGAGMHPTVTSVEATLPVYVIKDLELAVDFEEAPGARAANLIYEISPATITVSGDAELLRGVEAITLGQVDLLDLLGSGAGTHTFSIIIPEGCRNLSGVTRATLTVEFRDMTRRQVTTRNFRCENLPEGRQAEIITQQMTVSIFGTAADTDAVLAEDVTVVADLTNFSGASGTYTVPATVQVDSAGDVGVSGTYHVQVTITDEGEVPAQPDPEAPQEEQENPV